MQTIQCARVGRLDHPVERSKQTRCNGCQERVWVSEPTISLAAKVATPAEPLRLFCESCMPAKRVDLT